MHNLVSKLNNYNQNYHILKSKNARVLIIEHGGRILGVDLGIGNFLWVNDNLENCFMGKDWNLGGIRTWLSPERNFFYHSPIEFNEWYCQSGIDPANYKFIKKKSKVVKLESNIEAVDQITKEKIFGKLVKKIELKEHTREEDNQKLTISQESKLTIDNYEGDIALWTLVQVPASQESNGHILIPTKKHPEPVHYFNRIPNDYLSVHKSIIDFKIDGNKELKLGLRPEDLLSNEYASIFYHFSKTDKSCSIVMTSTTHAKNQNDCVDPPKADPKMPKGVIQIYNSDFNKTKLKFGELEIHSSKAQKNKKNILEANEVVTFEFKISNKIDL